MYRAWCPKIVFESKMYLFEIWNVRHFRMSGNERSCFESISFGHIECHSCFFHPIKFELIEWDKKALTLHDRIIFIDVRLYWNIYYYYYYWRVFKRTNYKYYRCDVVSVLIRIRMETINVRDLWKMSSHLWILKLFECSYMWAICFFFKVFSGITLSLLWKQWK